MIKRSIVAGMISLLLPITSWAASMTFDNSTDPGQLHIKAGQFEGGFSVNSNQIQVPGVKNIGTVTLAESAGSATFTGNWVDLGNTLPPTRTIYFTDPGNPAVVTDILILNFAPDAADTSNGVVSGTWNNNASAPLGAIPGGTPAGDIITANGTQVTFSAPFLGGRASASVPGAIPQPIAIPANSHLALFLMVLLLSSIGWFSIRKR